MNDHSRFRGSVPCHGLVIVCAAWLILAPSASAGFNPIKKAKDAVSKPAEKTPQAQTDEPVVFDEYTLELTDARIEGILSACKVAAQAAAARQPIVDKLNKVSDERGKLDDKQGEAVRELQSKRDDVERCYHGGYQKAMDKRTQEYISKATTDPAVIQKFSKLAQDQAMAQAKNDSVALAQVNAVMMEMVSPTHEDSLAVKKTCGPIPPNSAAEDQLAAYDKEIAALNEQLRQADDKASQAQAKASGMNDQQWGTARERILGFLAMYKPNKPEPNGYSDTELDALEKNLKQLQDAQKNGCF